jgi:hypothetical protein
MQHLLHRHCRRVAPPRWLTKYSSTRRQLLSTSRTRDTTRLATESIPLAPVTSAKPTDQDANVAHLKRFIDYTIFNNGTSTPRPGRFYFTNVRGKLDASFVIDCRRVTTRSTKAHPFRHELREEASITDVLTQMLEIPLDRAKFLLHIGAVQLYVFPPEKAMSKIDEFPEPQRTLMLASRQYFEQEIRSRLHVVRGVHGYDDPAVAFETPNRVRDPSIVVSCIHLIDTSVIGQKRRKSDFRTNAVKKPSETVRNCQTALAKVEVWLKRSFGRPVAIPVVVFGLSDQSL